MGLSASDRTAHRGVNWRGRSGPSGRWRWLAVLLGATLAVVAGALTAVPASADTGEFHGEMGPEDQALLGPVIAGAVTAQGIESEPYGGATYWPVSDGDAIGRALGSGHDFPVGWGTPVYAVRDGVVEASDDLVGYESRLPASMQTGYRSYGRYILIRHYASPGLMTYAHLSERLVGAGQHVYAGQLIGFSGATGYAYGPHLHIDWNRGSYTAVSWLAGQNPQIPPGAPPAPPPPPDYRKPAFTEYAVQAGQPGETIVGNLTVVNPAADGFVTAYPCAEGPSRQSDGGIAVSVGNFSAGDTDPSFVAIKADDSGRVCFQSSAKSDLVWDQTAETTAVNSHPVVRKLDTRSSTGVVKARATVKLQLGKAAAGQTIFGTLVAIGQGVPGFTTAFPCKEGLPRDANGAVSASVNNYKAKEVSSNFAVVRADANGDICLYTSEAAHLLWDQVAESTTVNAGQIRRQADTRLTGEIVAPEHVLRIKAGAANSTVLGNLTVTDTAGAGFTSAFPCDQGLPRDAAGLPNTSVNNFTAGETDPNFAAIRADGSGDICVYSSVAVQVIWDQSAQSSLVTAHVARRLLDTR